MDEPPALTVSAELNKLSSKTKRMEILESALAKFKASMAKLSSSLPVSVSEPNIPNNKSELITFMLDELDKLIVTVEGLRDAEETIIKCMQARLSAKRAEMETMKSLMARLEAELTAMEYKVATEGGVN